jgi:RNA polymerase sigma factor (TIGR02999 family)
MKNVTQLLQAIERGEPQASEELLPLVYCELRELAQQKLHQERAGQTLQATALVHEAYVRLVGKGEPPEWDGRGHFFAAAAEAMRRILIENARKKRRLKRGGQHVRNELDEGALLSAEPDERLVELDEALTRLEQKDPRKAKLVKLRYFAGLTQEEAALALGIGISTADRDWAYAKAWLFRELSQDEG